MKKISEMKKMTMICMAALLVTVMSCKKEKVENTAVGAGFRATLEAHAGDSKTHLEDVKVKWDLGDAVKVVNAKGDVKEFRIDNIHDDYADLVPAQGQEVTEDFYKPDYQAYYPVGLLTETGEVSLPGTQTYAANTFAGGCNPMAAYAVNKNLDFKNLCGLLALQLTGDCKVKSITITAKGGENLCGEGTLSFDGTGINMKPTLSALTGDNASPTITLNCYVNNEYVQLSATPKTFYFIVPAGTLSAGFDVVLTDSDDKVWRRSASQNTTINQNKIRTMPELAVVTCPEGALPGVFTVNSDGKQVYFSKGNLQYVKDGGKWQFAANQYDIVEAPNQDVGTNYGSAAVQTLFGWGDLTPLTTSKTADYSWTDDWGTKIDGKVTWRTLNKAEWMYLISSRIVNGDKGEGKSYQRATVNSVYGMILYPDNYTKQASYATTDWATMEAAGCVFLPAAGYRNDNKCWEVGSCSRYWSSSSSGNDKASSLYFTETSTVVPNSDLQRYMGASVRLVSNVPAVP